ncbi:hypothetical protein SLS56_012106 [Neofusicoccum ribis]|uniref:Uncharacterized protein n=1 Tax=Neofusicoccum ribis TaxID=45134 RepID=A0ABR3SAG2_9PEZI
MSSLLTEHRAYQLGLSPESLGAWRSKVERKSLLGMQSQMYTPTVSLPMLVKEAWKPHIALPVGSDIPDQHPTGDPERCLAKASWVNFMKALGLSPATEKLYSMNVQSELINGIIPMRWKGKDLVGICSMLGFQSHEDKPSFKSPMPLPTQWSGPLGWLQFRASADGCICEYRPRRHLENQLPQQVHDSYKDTKKPDQPHSLKSRLWQSINGMSMLDDRLLYLGGTDRRRPGEDLQRSVDGLLDSNKSSADSDTSRPQNDHLFDELMMAADLTQEDVIGRMAGGKKEQPDEFTSRLKQLEKEIDFLPEFLRGIAQKKGTKEVLQPCPGLLSVVIEGELAQSRGLDIGQCQEYHHTYTEHDKVDRKKYPYSLGALCMDDDLLELMKDAIALLKPDGFYFSPTAHLYSDVAEVYSHVDSQSNKLERIFPDTLLTDMSANHQDIRELHDSMVLCNKLQHIRKNVRAVFTVVEILMMAA